MGWDSTCVIMWLVGNVLWLGRKHWGDDEWVWCRRVRWEVDSQNYGIDLFNIFFTITFCDRSADCSREVGFGSFWCGYFSPLNDFHKPLALLWFCELFLFSSPICFAAVSFSFSPATRNPGCVVLSDHLYSSKLIIFPLSLSLTTFSSDFMTYFIILESQANFHIRWVPTSCWGRESGRNRLLLLC